MPQIHATAMVDPQAQLDDDVVIGPYSIVGPHVVIGAGTTVGAHCVLENRTTLGRGNCVFHHVCLGQEPQDLKFHGEPATLVIGDNNDIRENVTAHIGTENGGGITTIGDHNLLMAGTHIAHDCRLDSHCILANNVLLAGHVFVHDYAIISGGAAASHYVTIGRHAFVGGLAGVVHDCPPFLVSDGHPNRPRSVNLIGLGRHRFDPTTVDRIKRVYVAMYGRKARKANSNTAAIDALLEAMGDDAHVVELLDFIRRSAAAPNGRLAELERDDNKRTAPIR